MNVVGAKWHDTIGKKKKRDREANDAVGMNIYAMIWKKKKNGGIEEKEREYSEIVHDDFFYEKSPAVILPPLSECAGGKTHQA